MALEGIILFPLFNDQYLFGQTLNFKYYSLSR